MCLRRRRRLPDKEELATAHDDSRIPEGAVGIRGHVRLYPNTFFAFANLNGCAHYGQKSSRDLRLPRAAHLPTIGTFQRELLAVQAILLDTAMNALPQFGFRYRSAVLFTHPPDRC